MGKNFVCTKIDEAYISYKKREEHTELTEKSFKYLSKQLTK